jgi:hypothetical protein
MGGKLRYSRAMRRCSTSVSLGLWMPSARWRATSFSMENWLHWIPKEDLPFRFFKTTYPGLFRSIFPLTRDGETVPIERRRDLLDRMFAAPKDPLRLSPLLQAPSGQVVEAVRNLGLEGVVGKRVELHGPTATSCGGWQAEFARHTCQFRVCRPITPALIATLIPNGTYISSQLSRGSTCCRIRYRRFSQPGGLWAYC